VLLPSEKGVEPTDLQFLEFARYIERILGPAGMKKAASIGDADLLIFLAYGIGAPQEHTYTYSVPTWGQTGVSSSYTTGTVSTYGGTSSYSGTTSYTPRYGITGSRTEVGSFTSFTRYFRLEAMDGAEFRETKGLKQVWVTSVVSSGSSGDLRLVFPYMVAAAHRRVGSNTGAALEIAIPEGDPLVRWVLGQPQTATSMQASTRSP